MKKLLVLSAFFVMFSSTIIAQNYTRDVGIRIGDYFTGSVRQYNEDDRALECMIFIGRRGMTAGVMKEFFEPALGHLSDNLYFQYGYGAHIGFRYTDHYQVLNRTYNMDDWRFTPLLGINGIAGIEYRFPEFPFLIAVDIKPYFEYSTIQIFSIYIQSVGISLKYRF